MARGFKIADAYVEITTDLDDVRKGARDIPRAVGPDLDRSGTEMGKRLGKSLGDESTRQGNDAGGKLSQGIHLSIVRNSPLIAAAVGGALALGAPVALAGATALFAGIGIAAAFQSKAVQKAWTDTWEWVRDGAIEAAKPIEGVLGQLAKSVSDRFDAILPQLGRAFDALAPQIGVLADGVLDLAQNALPGMFRAVGQGMPVTQGLADMLGKVGTGLSDFFDRVSSHAPAAGQVFSSLGDSLAALLPTLGELLGQGVELAANVLPLLSSSLGLVLQVVTALGPALPALAAGLGAMKIANSVGDGFAALAVKLEKTAAGGGMFAGTAGRMSAGLSSIASAAGPAAAAIGFAAVAISTWNDLAAKAEDLNLRLGQAIRVGGSQAEAAAHQFNIGDEISSWIPDAIENFSFLGHSVSDMIPSAKNADDAFQKWYGSLGASGQAAADVKMRTEDLDLQLRKYGEGSDEANRAGSALAQAQARAAEVSGQLEMATRGVTDAMVDQANQALASISSDFAYQDSLDNLETLQTDLNAAIRDHGAASEEASDATRGLGEGLLSTATNAGRAKADMSGLKEGTAEYARTVQVEALAELYRLRDAFPQMAGPIDGMIGKLEAAGVSLTEVGDYHPNPTVDANTDPLLAKTAGAMGVLDVLSGQRPLPIAGLDPSPLNANFQGAMNVLGVLSGQRPMPIGGLNTGPFGAGANYMSGTMNFLGGLRATPYATLIASTAAAEAAINYTARARTATVYLRQVGAALADGGPVHPVVKAAGGRIVGPGGPQEDRVPAVGPGGVPWALSNGEWVIKQASAAKYGPYAMSAINQGTATVSVPSRGMAAGGETSASVNGSGFAVQNLNVHIHGADLTDSRGARAVAEKIRTALVSLEREAR